MALEEMVSAVAGWIPAPAAGRAISALCYHRVLPFDGAGPADRFTIDRGTLIEHVETVIRSGRSVVGPGRFADTAGPAVMFTFDDNLVSHVRDAMPVLRDHGVRGVFFLNPGEFGERGQLTRADVDTLVHAGMWIGAHNNRHVPACEFDEPTFADEVDACRRFLSSLDMPLTWAYPGGHIGSFDARHERVLRDHGFDLRFSTLEGRCYPADLTHAQNRYVIRRGVTPRYFRAALTGGLQLVRYCKRFKAMAGTWRT